MTLLTTISNEAVNDNLQKRWTNGEIYTYIGAVLISVNPFKGQPPLPSLPLYQPLLSSVLYRSRYIHRRRSLYLQGQEPSRDASPRLRHRRVGVLQYASLS